MSTASATATPTNPAHLPATNRVKFDPFLHAQYFEVEKMRLSASTKGHPQLIVETDCELGCPATTTVTA